MTEIIIPVIIVSSIGLIAGLGLAVASIMMAVPKNEKAEKLEKMLPGANCGACGYSGCSGYALALANGEAEIGLCSPGGEMVLKKTLEILGGEAKKVEYKSALIKCMGSEHNTEKCMNYQGIETCSAACMLYRGISKCSYGCIGFGDCKEACPYGAINICNGLAVIDHKKCKGCSKCVAACPKKIIKLVPLKNQAVVRCSNCNKGSITNKVCKIGCIGCMRCVKICEHGAITVKNFLARVDSQKCVGCGKCIEACKRGCIAMLKTDKN